MLKYLILRNVFILLLLILVSIDFLVTDISLFIYSIVALFFIILAIGSAKIQLDFFTKGHHSLDTDEKAISLTFDDGPHPVYTPQILSILDRYKAKATFFCIGKHIEAHEDVLQEISKRGHRVGNHSYSHSYFFSFLSSKRVIKEINKTNVLIHSITGKDCNIFRPPYGVTNPPIARAINLLSMKLIGWNIRSFDTSTKDPKMVVRRVIKKIKPGAVILLHDNRKNTPEILDAILQYTSKNNYKYLHV
ncbi:MAG: polysaccharide deacetylase family protein [Candidatus Cyclobacteriaceae bacterium M2_1C_046]